MSKSFGGVRALEDADFSLRAGEIHALVGENGAGKSTLMSVLSGALQADRGRIVIDGQTVSIGSPQAGRRLGVAIIYQEMALAPDLSVAENIFLGRLSDGVLVRWRSLNQAAGAWLGRLGTDLDPATPVRNLGLAEQQTVEICRALSENSRVLVLDEPTAALAVRETEALFGILRTLRAEGVGIVYVSHRLPEVFRIADRITVLRDGSRVATLKTAETTDDEIVQLMTGRRLGSMFPTSSSRKGEEGLRVEDLASGRKVRGVSFSVAAGEVIGLAGLVGSGRTETVRAIYGADRKDRGRILIHGKEIDVTCPADAVRTGVGLLPEDRKMQGVLLEMSVKVNATLSSLDRIASLGWIRRRREAALVDRLIARLNIKAGSIEDHVATLSGGNQQKVAVARWLASRCKVMLLDEPTRGIDVGAKAEIYDLIRELAAQGVSLVVVSSDLPEVVGLCDRILVMRDGRIVGELREDERSEEKILNLAMREDLGV